MEMFLHTLFLLLVARAFVEGFLSFIAPYAYDNNGRNNYLEPSWWVARSGYALISAGAVYVLTGCLILPTLIEFIGFSFVVNARFKNQLTADNALIFLTIWSVIYAVAAAVIVG